MRKLTGRRFSPGEFESLNLCVLCGRAEDIVYGGTCESCSADSIHSCSRCTRLARNGVYVMYTYDEFCREYSYEHEEHTELDGNGECEWCRGWESRIKHRCTKAGCGAEFTNDGVNLKRNGNLCAKCAGEYEEKYG